MAEVSYLKAKYLGYAFDEYDRFCLCHGDFHPGGVMVDGQDVKVIDPEFTVFGPPGLDLGSLLSGFVLAFIYHALGLGGVKATVGGDDDEEEDLADISSEKKPTNEIERRHLAATMTNEEVDLLEGVRCLWGRCEQKLLEEGIEPKQVRRISDDGVGFAMMEVVRTSLGFAGARDPARRISDPRALAQYQKISISLVRHCLLRRKGSGINGILLQQMEMAAQNAGGWRKQEERKRAAAAKK